MRVVMSGDPSLLFPLPHSSFFSSFFSFFLLIRFLLLLIFLLFNVDILERENVKDWFVKSWTEVCVWMGVGDYVTRVGMEEYGRRQDRYSWCHSDSLRGETARSGPAILGFSIWIGVPTLLKLFASNGGRLKLSEDSSLRYSFFNIYIFSKFIYFIYFWLRWVFVAAWAFLPFGGAGATLHCGAPASRCGGCSCWGAQALGMWASVVVAHGLSSCGSRAQ